MRPDAEGREGSSAEEWSLLERARCGDAAAFESLVAPYDRRLLRLALDLLGDPDDARDAYQEGLLAVYRALPGFRGESRFSTWMYRIALNQALRLRGRRDRSPSSRAESLADIEDGRATPVISEPAARGTDPEQLALRREIADRIRRALEDLSERERAAFVLCHLHGESLGEAARIMACSVGSVKSYLFRGRSKLRAALAAYMGD